MTKGYLDKPVPKPTPEKKELKKSEKISFAVGMALAFGGLIAVEALLVWVILAYLLKAKLAYVQVLGATLLFEYVLGRVKVKK